MPKAAAPVPSLLLSLALLVSTSACTTANYRIYDGDRTEIRFSGARAGETSKRPVDIKIRHHYFVFGLVANKDVIDIAKIVGLQPGEALVDTRIVNSMEGRDVFATIGLGIITFGILPIIWSTRTSTIRGEVVSFAGAGAAPKRAVTQEEEVTEEPTPPAVDDAVPGLTWLAEKRTQAAALAGCDSVGARLPTRAELKDLRAAHAHLQTTEGEVWTTERQEDDAWTYSFASGTAFLRDPDDLLATLCVLPRGAKAP